MKGVRYLSLIFLSMLFASCNDGGILKLKLKKLPPPEVLPPITGQGKNTFGCMVDGKVWIPADHSGIFIQTGISKLSNQYEKHSGKLSLSAARIRVEGEEHTSFYFFSDSLFEIREYPLWGRSTAPYDTMRCVADFGIGSTDYESVFGPKSWINILKLDTVNQIISGTFQFDAINEEDPTDTVKVREGRFDMKFYY